MSVLAIHQSRRQSTVSSTLVSYLTTTPSTCTRSRSTQYRSSVETVCVW